MARWLVGRLDLQSRILRTDIINIRFLKERLLINQYIRLEQIQDLFVTICYLLIQG